LQPSSAEVGNAAGNGAVGVIAPEGCDWVASSNDTWLSISSANSGAGNGSVSYAFTANPTDAIRVGSLTIAGQIFELKQAGIVTACNYSLNPSSAETGSAAGNGTVNIIAPEGCDWVASSNDAWLSISSDTSGAGNGTINYAFSANPTDTVRVGSLTIAGQNFVVTQAGEVREACDYSLQPSTAEAGSAAGSGTVSVSTSANCSWSAGSNDAWLSISSGATGTGNGIVSYEFTANADDAVRTGSLNIAGKIFELNQAGVICRYSIEPSSTDVSSAEGTGSVSIMTSANCSWRASSNEDWLSIRSGESGTGNGTIEYEFSANEDDTTRSAVLNISGQLFTLKQADPEPEVSLSELAFEGTQTYYQVGELLEANVIETSTLQRETFVDLWFALKLPSGVLQVVSGTGGGVGVFKADIAPDDTVHTVLRFNVPPEIGGRYELYAVYVESGGNPLIGSADILRSNVASHVITLSNADMLRRATSADTVSPCDFSTLPQTAATPTATDPALINLAFDGLHTYYQIGESLNVNVAEVLPLQRTTPVDLWFATMLPNGTLSTLSGSTGAFKLDIAPDDTVHAIVSFPIPDGIGGRYAFYALYTTPNTNLSTSKPVSFERSHLATEVITISNAEMIQRPPLTDSERPCDLSANTAR